MKRIFACLCITALATALCGCSEKNDSGETTDPQYGCVTFEGDYWTALIDSPQYGGALLYGEADGAGWYTGVEAYEWRDEATHLHSSLNESSGAVMYSNGGFAISNYASTELKADGNDKSYEHQLEVYAAGGHNDSATFAVANGYESEWMSGPSFDFADGIARTIAEAWIAPTTYCAAACTTAGVQELWIEAAGFDAAGEKTGTAKIFICQGGKFIDGWTKWDLTSLGKVAKVSFTIAGDETAYNEYGLSAPAYFAIDDIKIGME